jgi:heme-degrading monooxygenase HmoA
MTGGWLIAVPMPQNQPPFGPHRAGLLPTFPGGFDSAMYSATFIFAKKQFDDEFHRLDQTIAAAAKSLPGYLGEETWENPGNGLVSNVYYWDSLDSLQALIRHPVHQQAKAAQANWLDGYKVVISEVLRTYGDTRIDHMLAPSRQPG